jgi:hypothetical protein
VTGSTASFKGPVISGQHVIEWLYMDLINLALPVIIPGWNCQVLQKCNEISGPQKVLI